MNPARTTPGWIPAGYGRGLLLRLLLVSGCALLIALFNWSLHTGTQGLDIALVYSFAISLLTWASIDPTRFALRRWLHANPPGYWPPAGRAALLLFFGIPFGYVAGTAIGDAYAGRSTLDLVHTNRPHFTGLLLSSLAISIAFVGYFYQRGRNELLQRQAREAQLALLQSQLEPHLLFNTLANLRVLIALDPPRAQAMLDRLIAFLRATLGASRASTHPLAVEFDRIADYLALMQVRMGTRLQAGLDLPAELREVAVPPLLLQPLVENSIKHGLEPKVDGGRIEVSAQRQGELLVLSVRDSGVGLTEASAPDAEDGARFGLRQVRERLHTRYGKRAALELQPGSDGGTLARIRLPLSA
jgi:signal transduction histidine kinase